MKLRTIQNLMKESPSGKISVTRTELRQLEQYLDAVWAKLGIDIEFGKHFYDRINDKREQNRPITAGEIVELYKKSYSKYGHLFQDLGKRLGRKEIEAVLTDLSTKLNIPFALRWKRGKLELFAMTIMRNPNFKTSDKKYVVELKEIAMNLREIMDKPLPYEWTSVITEMGDNPQKVTKWKKIGLSDVAFFKAGDYDYKVFFTKYADSTVSIEFELVGAESGDDSKIGIENTGNSVKVFSTVIDIIKKYIKKNKPNAIGFSAEEKSRKKLYARLTKKIAGTMGYEFENGKSGERDAMVFGDFELVRK